MMTDDIGNLLLEDMRKFDRTLADMRDGIRDLGKPVTNAEEQLSILNRRMDRFDDHLSRIEKRLDLVEG